LKLTAAGSGAPKSGPGWPLQLNSLRSAYYEP